MKLDLALWAVQDVRRKREGESCQWNDVDMDENTEELSFIPSAVSCSAGLHEPQTMCDRKKVSGTPTSRQWLKAKASCAR